MEKTRLIRERERGAALISSVDAVAQDISVSHRQQRWARLQLWRQRLPLIAEAFPNVIETPKNGRNQVDSFGMVATKVTSGRVHIGRLWDAFFNGSVDEGEVIKSLQDDDS